MESPDDTSVGGVGGEAVRERARLLRRQVKVWTGQLVDLSGRNNLLYYRDLKRGTLDLGDAAPSGGGRARRQGRLAVAPVPDRGPACGCARRARAVRNRREEHFEERGLETLSGVRDGDVDKSAGGGLPAGAGPALSGAAGAARRRAGRVRAVA